MNVSYEGNMSGRKEDYIPTQEEIIKACRELQSSWTNDQEQKRSLYKTEKFKIKVIKPIEEKDNA